MPVACTSPVCIRALGARGGDGDALRALVRAAATSAFVPESVAFYRWLLALPRNLLCCSAKGRLLWQCSAGCAFWEVPWRAGTGGVGRCRREGDSLGGPLGGSARVLLWGRAPLEGRRRSLCLWAVGLWL